MAGETSETLAGAVRLALWLVPMDLIGPCESGPIDSRVN
jgi:hypothetical protein